MTCKKGCWLGVLLAGFLLTAGFFWLIFQDEDFIQEWTVCASGFDRQKFWAVPLGSGVEEALETTGLPVEARLLAEPPSAAQNTGESGHASPEWIFFVPPDLLPRYAGLAWPCAPLLTREQWLAGKKERSYIELRPLTRETLAQAAKTPAGRLYLEYSRSRHSLGGGMSSYYQYLFRFDDGRLVKKFENGMRNECGWSLTE